MGLVPVEFLQKKRDRKKLSEDEIREFTLSFAQGKIPDYQMSAWLMAVVLNGLDEHETFWLTRAMLESGKTMDFSALGVPVVDKHSTGGVGDKTTLILAPLVASLGIAVPTIAGRGLGHTGGTLDKLESIPGFSTQQNENRFAEIMREHLLCFMGQTDQICPADKKMYALRDVTGTVESIPLICASIMSKKLAEGLDGLVLDVKFGSGAFMRTIENAELLARNLISIGRQAGKRVHALLTDMNQPMGRFVGNALEVSECISILRGDRSIAPDTRALSLELASHMIWISGLAANKTEALGLAEKNLESGQAMEKFEAVVRAQGGNLKDLPKPVPGPDVLATEDGYIESIDTQAVGFAGIVLGAGRMQLTDRIDPSAGFEFHAKIGDSVQKGAPIVTLYGGNSALFPEAEARLRKAIRVSKEKITPRPLVAKILT